MSIDRQFFYAFFLGKSIWSFAQKLDSTDQINLKSGKSVKS